MVEVKAIGCNVQLTIGHKVYLHIFGEQHESMVFLHMYVRIRGVKMCWCAILWFQRGE